MYALMRALFKQQTEGRRQNEKTTLVATGSPGGGEYSWVVTGNDGICDESGEKTKKITFTAQKPGEFTVKSKYAKDGDTAVSTEKTDIIVPHELEAFFKTEFEQHRDDKNPELVKKNGGPPLKYVILQGKGNAHGQYDNLSNSKTHITVRLEKYETGDPDPGSGATFTLKSTGDQVQFFADKNGTPLQNGDLTFADLRGEGKKVYLSGQMGDKLEDKVDIWLEVSKPDTGVNYREGDKGSFMRIDGGGVALCNMVDLNMDIENVDKVLLKDNISSFVDKNKVSSRAFAQACIQKCGTKDTKSHVHINIGAIGQDIANSYIYEVYPDFSPEEIVNIERIVDSIITGKKEGGVWEANNEEEARNDLIAEKRKLFLARKTKQGQIQPIKYVNIGESYKALNQGEKTAQIFTINFPEENIRDILII